MGPSGCNGYDDGRTKKIIPLAFPMHSPATTSWITSLDPAYNHRCGPGVHESV